jgi:hypothetical protein
MIRLIDAEILKLRRRTGMLVMVALLSVGIVAGYYGVTAAIGNDQDFGDIVAILALSGSVIGVIVGATAGAADIEAGVFRDLVATGRSRVSLFLARVPGACAIVLPPLAVSVIGAALVTGGGDVGLALVQVLGAGALAATVCVGLAALTGSRGTVIGLALAFQLGVSPMLGQWEAIGDGRFAIPQVALARLGGGTGDIGLAAGAALAILLAWAAAALAAGAWRSTTQEI